MVVMDHVFLGTTIKIMVEAQGTPQIHLDECDFTVYIWTSDKNDVESPKPENYLSCIKESCVPDSEDTYLVEVPTELIGKGYVIVRVEMSVPDTDCANGYRKEVLQSLPNIKIV